MDNYPFQDIMSALGVGVKDLADFLGLSSNHAQMIVKGRRNLGDEHLIEFSKLYVFSMNPPANPAALAAYKKLEMEALRQSLSARNLVLIKQWRSIKNQIESTKAIWIEASNVLARLNGYDESLHEFNHTQILWLEEMKAYWLNKRRENDTAALYSLLARENAIKQELAFNRKTMQSGLPF